ncbi:MAG TPA: futalosine hydrolase [Chitinophagales bacterium]|nr:futalosine hydrolase [Chitinophagales bacterium]
MKITVVAATKMEVQPIIQELGLILENNNNFYSSSNDNIHVLITGMGMMQTATHLAIYAMQHSRDLYIDAGVAGAFNRDIAIGEVVQVISETYGDFGVEDGDDFKDFYDLGFIDLKEDEFEHGLLHPYGVTEIIQNQLPFRKVSSLTVNKVHGKEESIRIIMNKYPADIENMEGLAFFNVLNVLKQPCIEIRSISNYVERRNKENWDLPLSLKNLNQALLDFIQKIS